VPPRPAPRREFQILELRQKGSAKRRQFRRPCSLRIKDPHPPQSAPAAPTRVTKTGAFPRSKTLATLQGKIPEATQESLRSTARRQKEERSARGPPWPPRRKRRCPIRARHRRTAEVSRGRRGARKTGCPNQAPKKTR